MNKPSHHIFVCMSFRAGGDQLGKCAKKGSGELLGYLENELSDRGMNDFQVSTSGCLKMCDHGPVMIIYPEGLWYGGVDSENAIDEILDAWEEKLPARKYLIEW